jgi:plastocyanin
MRQSLVIGLATAMVAAAAAFVVVNDVHELAEANHSAPGAADTHIVHAHDDYFHPEPLTGPWADHTAAQLDCQGAAPMPQCDMAINIEIGDSVEWWTKPPFHANPHTVTECTDGTFAVCGAAVDPANPIGDSGVFAGGAVVNTLRYGPITFTASGTYYYRCDVHPSTMRGRITVTGPTPTPTPEGTPTPHPGTGNPPGVGGIAGLVNAETGASAPASGSGPGESTIAVAAVATAVVLATIGGLSLWRRALARRVKDDDVR